MASHLPQSFSTLTAKELKEVVAYLCFRDDGNALGRKMSVFSPVSFSQSAKIMKLSLATSSSAHVTEQHASRIRDRYF